MNIIYNSANINDGVNYFVEESDHEETAKAEINLQKIARTNDSVLLRKNFGIKTINMFVIVKDSSKDLLDARIDTFKQTIEAENKNLDIAYASSTRRFVCTGYCGKVERKLRWARIAVKFECYKAFGEDTSSTTESFAGKTTSPYTDDIEIAGSAPAQPDITITINSITSADEKYLQIKNTDNGDYIKVSADDWAEDDVVVISTRNATVTRNGSVSEYLGIMPDWIPGVNNWEYTDNFDARNVDISFSYKKRFL